MRLPAPFLHRPRALLAGTLVLAAVLLLAPAASAGITPGPGERARSIRAPHCTMNGAKTIAANRHVRVFRARGEVFGCRRSANRAYEIGHGGQECQNSDLIDSAVVAGNFVALNVRTCSLDSSGSKVSLVNLRDGRGRFSSAPLSSTADRSEKSGSRRRTSAATMSPRERRTPIHANRPAAVSTIPRIAS